MSNDRLAAALNNTPTGLKAREDAKKRANHHKGLYHDCGFCGRDWGSPLLSGPLCGICEECATFATGFYLVAARDRLNINDQFREIWQRAATDYGRHEGKPPQAKEPGARSA